VRLRDDGPAIAVTGLRKSFGEHVVLDAITFAVEPGTVFALLGPNGSGKTTTVNILSTLLAPDTGDVLVAGRDVVRDPEAVRATIGLTGQFSAVDDLLTGRENLALMANLQHLARYDARGCVDELLERFELCDAAERTAATYSGGMRRRLDLAMTLVGTPTVLFLDEPTTGLDPRSRRTMWDSITALVADGVTVLLTTQYLDEADRLADRVAILDAGRLVAQGTPEELKRRVPGGHIDLEFADAAAHAAAAGVLHLSAPEGDTLKLQVPSETHAATLHRVLRELDDAHIDITDISLHTPDLDDVFFALTGAPATSQAATAREPS
jgi:ABC-2 type transport system ATP-binding protein